MNDTIYQAWHRRLGHAEYRISITMQGYSNDEDAAEAFLEGWLEAHPEAGAVISQNTVDDTVTATFALSATNESHALDLGATFWIEAGVASGLEPHDVVRAEVERVTDDELDQVDERASAIPA